MSKSLSALDFLSPTSASASSSAGEQFLQFHLEPDITALLSIQHLTEVLTIPIEQIVPIFNMPPWVMGVYNWRGEILWMVDLNHLVGLTPWYQQMSRGGRQIVLDQSQSLLQPTNPSPTSHTKLRSNIVDRKDKEDKEDKEDKGEKVLCKNATRYHTAIVLDVRSHKSTSISAKSKILGIVVNQVEDIEWYNPNLIQSPSSSTVTSTLVPFLRGCWLKANGELLVVIDAESIFSVMLRSAVLANS